MGGVDPDALETPRNAASERLCWPDALVTTSDGHLEHQRSQANSGKVGHVNVFF